MPMGNTDSTAEQAAKHLAHLVDYCIELPNRAHTGGRTAPVRSIERTAPLNVDTVSHIDATVREIRSFMAAESPDTIEPLPKDAADVYDWMIRNTEFDDDTTRRRRDILIYRQYLEHAVLTGDSKAVRRHPCPACGCVGVHWQHTLGKAVCRNRRCRTADQGLNTWTLAHLAQQHIEAQEKLTARAT